MKRVVSLGLMIALLVMALHVVMDHGASGQVVFFSHASPLHLDDDHPTADGHHQQDDEGESPGEPHTDHHHADTHSHCTWSPPLEAPITWPLDASLIHACVPGVPPPGPGPLPLPVSTSESPPRRVPLYLRCHSLLI
jgi:hypothetical protein